MNCFQPIYVKNRGYSGCVPCGTCPACRQKRSLQWIFRLSQEALHSKGCLFLTLTYNEDSVPVCRYVDKFTGELIEGIKTVKKDDVQKFIHDLRKQLYGDSGGPLRYFCCSEYGPTTKRPHYHLILFNFPDIKSSLVSPLIEKCWRKGFVKIAPLNRNRIRYVCKYCLTDSSIDYFPVFNLMSQGIGRDWLSPSVIFSFRHSPRLYTVDQYGFKVSLHRYYIDKLWPNKFMRKLVMLKLTKEYQNEKRSSFENCSQNIADSFGSSYQIDRCEGTSCFGREGNRREVVFGPSGAWLANYYSKLKRSKFEI